MNVEPRIAIVSDPLVQRGGAERVVEAFAEAFPTAPIYALLYSPESGPSSLEAKIRTSWLQKIPLATKKHRFFFPMYAQAIESFDLSGFDVILSSHHTVAKGLLRNADQLHICYCHTPMRALWERSASEIKSLPGPMRPVASHIFKDLRQWDYVASGRVDRFVANSRITQSRILRHYGRESSVLAPPIDTDRFSLDATSHPSDPYYLVACRPVPYKRVDIAAEAAIRAGRRLIVAGGDHKLPRHPNIEVVGSVDDATLIGLMRGAKALLFPQYEDFGMTPLEMNACGRPVIAYGAGGALETISDSVNGIHVPEQSVDAFVEAIARFESMEFKPETLRRHAESYSKKAFVSKIRAAVYDAWAERISL